MAGRMEVARWLPGQLGHFREQEQRPIPCGVKQRLPIRGFQRAVVSNDLEQPDDSLRQDTRCQCYGSRHYQRHDAPPGDFSDSSGEPHSSLRL